MISSDTCISENKDQLLKYKTLTQDKYSWVICKSGIVLFELDLWNVAKNDTITYMYI